MRTSIYPKQFAAQPKPVDGGFMSIAKRATLPAIFN